MELEMVGREVEELKYIQIWRQSNDEELNYLIRNARSIRILHPINSFLRLD
jgi:hypothetical protein